MSTCQHTDQAYLFKFLANCFLLLRDVLCLFSPTLFNENKLTGLALDLIL